MFAVLHGMNGFYVHKVMKKRIKKLILALLPYLMVPKWQSPVPGKCLVKVEMCWIMEFGVVCSFKDCVFPG